MAFAGGVRVVPGDALLEVQMRTLPPLSHSNSTCGLVAGARYEPLQMKLKPLDAVSRFRVPCSPPQSWKHVGDGFNTGLLVSLRALQDYPEGGRSCPALPPPVPDACRSPSPQASTGRATPSGRSSTRDSTKRRRHGSSGPPRSRQGAGSDRIFPSAALPPSEARKP